jgi:hypothetical protein
MESGDDDLLEAAIAAGRELDAADRDDDDGDRRSRPDE